MKVLCLSAKWLGDAVNTTGGVAALQRAWPGAAFGVLVGAQGSGVFEEWPDAEVLVRPKRSTWRARFGVLAQLRRRKYDLAVAFEASEQMALLTRLAGVPKRVGVCKPGKGRHLTLRTEQRPDEHEVRGPIPRVLRLVDVDDRGAPELRLSPDEERFGPEMLQDAFGARHAVALHLGANAERKMWDLGQATELAVALRDRGFGVLLVGGPNDPAHIPGAMSLVGKLRVREMAAVLAACRAMVCTDSGPMHVGAAVGVPQVALFGPTNPARYGPFGARHLILRENCSCPERAQDSHDGCTGACTRAIPASKVLNALDQLGVTPT